nr:MAG TPA: replicative helicase [Caudoviricetes sp.]
MEIKTLLTNEEQLTSWLFQRLSISSRFRLECTKEEAITLLRSAIKAEVLSRNRNPVFTAETNAVIDRIATSLTNSPPSKFGVMMSGQCGNGKTTMSKAISNSIRILSLSGRYSSPNLMVPFMTAKEIVSTTDEERDKIKRSNLLSVDDMGNEPLERLTYGNVTNPLVDVLEYRYDKQLFTIVTTNLTPPQITEKYGQRIADRFREMFEVIVFQGGSFRF